MAKQKKKRNHWVSQAYLRTFAADDKRQKIWVLGKDAGDPELKPIKKVAVKFYLYAPKGPGGRDYQFEEKLATLEQFFGEDFWKVVCTGFVDLGDVSIRKALSLLTAVMWLRNPLHLDLMHDMHRQIVEFIAQAPELPDEIEINGKTIQLDTSDWPAYREAGEDDIKRLWLKEVGSATWLAELFMKMRWAVVVSETPVFITTDNPVVAMHPSLRFRGFKNPETFVAFPLSPTRLLFLDNRHSEPDNQYYPVKEGAPGLNGLLWRHSINAMFSSRHTDEVCAEMCADAEKRGFTWSPGG